MSTAAAKEGALGIGSQLASIESTIGRIMGMTMQAAIHHQPGVAGSAYQEALLLDDMVTALCTDLRRFQKALRS